jgi:GH15 family glucan-1,4-alpha-glucosidase
LGNQVPYKPISDYGVVGDMHSAALIGLDGSIDWLCFPDFDSPSVFAAILDDGHGGRWRLWPAGPHQAQQSYVPDTNILSTTFSTERGVVEILDLMPLSKDLRTSEHRVLRIVRGVTGSVEMDCLFAPRLDYAEGQTDLRKVQGAVVGEKGESRLALASPIDLSIKGGTARGVFAVPEGKELVFELEWGADRAPSTADWRERMEFTTREWRRIANSITYEGRWREEVHRSVLALHLLLCMPTGAMVAAATTSLPEWIGGGRNWDYRFCWMRDAAFAMDVLDRLNHTAETRRFLEWLTTFPQPYGPRLRTLYGVRYDEDLPEVTLDHLEGYRGSKPVRIGNAASTQLQMDIFGEVMVSYATFHRASGEISDEMWSTIESFVDVVIQDWRRPDQGIWEVRGRMRHFVHSKVMCWLAVDRAITLAESLSKPVDLDRWRAVREEIHADVLTHGWNEQVKSFVQYYGADHTDSALLMMPLVGFLPADDPRMRSTVRRIKEELDVDGLLRRYRTEHTDDGLGTTEGVFTMCSLWLAGYLTFIGELDEAVGLFERVLACGNHLGLFSEMVDPVTGEALGNFPQAFTHVSLIHTARNLDLALRQQAAPGMQHVQVGEAGRREATD